MNSLQGMQPSAETPSTKLRQLASLFLFFLKVGSVLFGSVTCRLGQAAIVDWLTVALAVVAAVLLMCFRLNSLWLVLGGAAVGLAATLF